MTVAQVRERGAIHEVWKGYQGRWKRCPCDDPERPHYEDPPPPRWEPRR